MNPCECDTCWYYDYDEEYDEYYCMMDLDEDEVYRIFSTPRPAAPSTGRAMITPLQGDNNHEAVLTDPAGSVASV